MASHVRPSPPSAGPMDRPSTCCGPRPGTRTRSWTRPSATPSITSTSFTTSRRQSIQGSYLRWVDVAHRWPEDRHSDSHNSGLILAATFWDLSRSVGVDLAARLYHFAKYGLPDDPSDPGVAMSEYFVQTLVADDNDHNLGNGTPHFAAINAAFDAHGIGTGHFLNIAHTPLADQANSGPF